MGLNKKAKREAAEQQKQAFAQQQEMFKISQQQAKEYQAGFNTRNAGLIDIRDRGTKFLGRYDKGVDIAELMPASVKLNQQAADTVKNTSRFASRMGDASQQAGGKNYQAKLNSVTERNVARGLAAINDERLSQEVGQQTSNIFNATGALNQDAQAGLGLNNQLFGMTDSIWQNATTRRNMEIQIAQQAFGNLMQVAQLGVGFATGAFGAGGMFASGGMFGKKGATLAPPSPPSRGGGRG